MKFTTFARPVSLDDFLGGVGGLLLRDVLEENGGQYEHRFVLAERPRNDIRKLAELTSDPELAAIADAPSILISLEHLRGLDPDVTRVRIGAEVTREETDGPLPGFDT